MSVRPAAAPGTVALNALFLEPNRVGGTETYVRALVPALARLAPERRFVLILSREAGLTAWDVPSNVEIDVAPCRAVSRPQRIGWELTRLVARARSHGAAVLHSLGTTSPLRGRIPMVVTVHDLIFEVFPEAFPGVRAKVLGALAPRMARRADRVIADSEATRRDVITRYRARADRVEVVHLGPGRPPAEQDAATAARLRRAVGAIGPYVLSVATTQPHKNIGRLVAAFQAVRAARPDIRLVLVGAAGTAEGALRDQVTRLGLADAVVMPGRVDDATLDALYAGAMLFVYPSLYEGFGLPLLEAMQRGVPVVSSDRTSLPEVGGDAVEYVDPESEGAIAAGILSLAGDERRRGELVEAGRRRLAGFTWERTARETLAVYDGLAPP